MEIINTVTQKRIFYNLGLQYLWVNITTKYYLPGKRWIKRNDPLQIYLLKKYCSIYCRFWFLPSRIYKWKIYIHYFINKIIKISRFIFNENLIFNFRLRYNIALFLCYIIPFYLGTMTSLNILLYTSRS